MAEANSSNSKIGILAKAQKQLSRTKTKVLQNLGKAEKTTDDQFKDYVLKTDKQLEAALHLQKELKNYAHCVRDLSQASKSLQNAFMDIYEPEWTSESTFKSQLQAFDLLWNDYLQNLQDTVTAPMHAYLHSFPVLKTKVAKRGRKMVDYDNCRHNLDVLLAAKKKDDSKIQKAQDELKEVKKIFDDLNNELHTELPDFYNSRVTFYADLFSRFFGAEHRLHSEVGKTCESLTDIAQALGKDFEQFKYVPKRPLSVSESTINGDISSASSPPTPIPSSSSSVTHTAVKEPMYTNQEQSNQQQLPIRPKRKAPIAPRSSRQLTQIQEQASHISLEISVTEQCNSLSSNESHFSVQSETSRPSRKYFSRWMQRFKSKKSEIHSSMEECSPQVERKEKQGAAELENLANVVMKVQGVKSLEERLVLDRDIVLKAEKMKTMSLPDYLETEKEPAGRVTACSKVISTVQNVRAANTGPKRYLAQPGGQDNISDESTQTSVEEMQDIVNSEPSSVAVGHGDEVTEVKRAIAFIESTLQNRSHAAQNETHLTKSSNSAARDEKVAAMILQIKILLQSIDQLTACSRDVECSEDYGFKNLLDLTSSDRAAPLTSSQDAHSKPNVEEAAESCGPDEDSKRSPNQQDITVEEVLVVRSPGQPAGVGQIAGEKVAPLTKSWVTQNISPNKMPTSDQSLEARERHRRSFSGDQRNKGQVSVNLQLLSDIRRDGLNLRWSKPKKMGEPFGKFKNQPPREEFDSESEDNSTIKEMLEDRKSSTPAYRTLTDDQDSDSSSSKNLETSEQKQFYKIAFFDSSTSVETDSEITNRESKSDCRKALSSEPQTRSQGCISNEPSVIFSKEKLHFLNQHLLKKHLHHTEGKKESCEKPVVGASHECDGSLSSPENLPLKERFKFLNDHFLKRHGLIQRGNIPDYERNKNEMLSSPKITSLTSSQMSPTKDSNATAIRTNLPEQKALSSSGLGENSNHYSTQIRMSTWSHGVRNIHGSFEELSMKKTPSCTGNAPSHSLPGPWREDSMKTIATSKARIPSHSLPGPWREDSMRCDYEIITVYTEDLSKDESCLKEKTDNTHTYNVADLVETGLKLVHSETGGVAETVDDQLEAAVDKIDHKYYQRSGKGGAQMVEVHNESEIMESPTGNVHHYDVERVLSSISVSETETLTYTSDINEISLRDQIALTVKEQVPVRAKEQDKLIRQVQATDGALKSEEPTLRMNNQCSLSKEKDLQEKLLMSKKTPEAVRYVKSDKSMCKDDSVSTLSDSVISLATEAEQPMKQDDSGSDPSVSMASNRWNLRGLMSMLLPITVQTLASHTKSYIHSYLQSNRPSERDALEIQKIVKENLSREDYYNLLGHSKDSSVDLSIKAEDVVLLTEEAETTNEEFKSLSSAGKNLDSNVQPEIFVTVDLYSSDSEDTPLASENCQSPAALDQNSREPENLVEPLAAKKEENATNIRASDLDILDQHFQTVLLDIVTKGSSRLKKSSGRNPQSTSRLASDFGDRSEEILSSSEELDKEGSFMLHDAMLSRLQMSLPLLSKSQNKTESSVTSEEGSLENACSWTLSKESLLTKSSDDIDPLTCKVSPDTNAKLLDSPAKGKVVVAENHPADADKHTSVLSPPLDLTLQASLASRRGALKFTVEEDDCLTNSSLDESDQCTHASKDSSELVTCPLAVFEEAGEPREHVDLGTVSYAAWKFSNEECSSAPGTASSSDLTIDSEDSISQSDMDNVQVLYQLPNAEHGSFESVTCSTFNLTHDFYNCNITKSLSDTLMTGDTLGTETFKERIIRTFHDVQEQQTRILKELPEDRGLRYVNETHQVNNEVHARTPKSAACLGVIDTGVDAWVIQKHYIDAVDKNGGEVERYVDVANIQKGSLQHEENSIDLQENTQEKLDKEFFGWLHDDEEASSSEDSSGEDMDSEIWHEHQDQLRAEVGKCCEFTFRMLENGTDVAERGYKLYLNPMEDCSGGMSLDTRTPVSDGEGFTQTENNLASHSTKAAVSFEAQTMTLSDDTSSTFLKENVSTLYTGTETSAMDLMSVSDIGLMSDKNDADSCKEERESHTVRQNQKKVRFSDTVHICTGAKIEELMLNMTDMLNCYTTDEKCEANFLSETVTEMRKDRTYAFEGGDITRERFTGLTFWNTNMGVMNNAFEMQDNPSKKVSDWTSSSYYISECKPIVEHGQSNMSPKDLVKEDVLSQSVDQNCHLENMQPVVGSERGDFLSTKDRHFCLTQLAVPSRINTSEEFHDLIDLKNQLEDNQPQNNTHSQVDVKEKGQISDTGTSKHCTVCAEMIDESGQDDVETVIKIKSQQLTSMECPYSLLEELLRSGYQENTKGHFEEYHSNATDEYHTNARGEYENVQNNARSEPENPTGQSENCHDNPAGQSANCHNNPAGQSANCHNNPAGQSANCHNNPAGHSANCGNLPEVKNKSEINESENLSGDHVKNLGHICFCPEKEYNSLKLLGSIINNNEDLSETPFTALRHESIELNVEPFENKTQTNGSPIVCRAHQVQGHCNIQLPNPCKVEGSEMLEKMWLVVQYPIKCTCMNLVCVGCHTRSASVFEECPYIPSSATMSLEKALQKYQQFYSHDVTIQKNPKDPPKKQKDRTPRKLKEFPNICEPASATAMTPKVARNHGDVPMAEDVMCPTDSEFEQEYLAKIDGMLSQMMGEEVCHATEVWQLEEAEKRAVKNAVDDAKEDEGVKDAVTKYLPLDADQRSFSVLLTNKTGLDNAKSVKFETIGRSKDLELSGEAGELKASVKNVTDYLSVPSSDVKGNVRNMNGHELKSVPSCSSLSSQGSSCVCLMEVSSPASPDTHTGGAPAAAGILDHCPATEVAIVLTGVDNQESDGPVVDDVELKRGSSGGQVNGRGSKHDFSSPAPKEIQGADANRPASAVSRPVSAARSSLANTPNVEKEPKDDSDGDDDSDNSDKNNSMTRSRENNVYEDPIDAGSKGGKEAPSNHVAGVHSDDSDDGDDDDDDDDEEEGDYTQVPVNHPVVAPPADTIFVVQATHKYTGEDMDELSFEAGEIIFVVPFENPDEQDDGWLMGIKQSDSVKGVFPENFTQRV